MLKADMTALHWDTSVQKMVEQIVEQKADQLAALTVERREQSAFVRVEKRADSKVDRRVLQSVEQKVGLLAVPRGWLVWRRALSLVP